MLRIPGANDGLPCSGYPPAILVPGKFGKNQGQVGKPDAWSGLFEMVMFAVSLLPEGRH